MLQDFQPLINERYIYHIAPQLRSYCTYKPTYPTIGHHLVLNTVYEIPVCITKVMVFCQKPHMFLIKMPMFHFFSSLSSSKPPFLLLQIPYFYMFVPIPVLI